MTNALREYNEYIRANLPADITYDSDRARYVTENGVYFTSYQKAKWYLDYIKKFGYELSSLPLYYQVGAEYWPAFKSEYLDTLSSNPDLTTATRDDMGADLSGSDKWIGGVLAPNGKIYCVPFNSADILIIDTVAGTATRSNMGANLSGSLKWFGGVLGTDGVLYGMPRDSTDILTIGTGTAVPLDAAASGWLNKL